MLLAGCTSTAPSLGGSLADLLPLEHDHLRARAYESELSIEWVDGARSDLVVVRVTVPHDGTLPATVDLRDGGTVSTGEDLGAFPPLLDGEAAFAEVGLTDGDRVSGEFRASFVPRDGVGHTLRGPFEATVEVMHVP